MARDAEGRTRAERKALRQAAREEAAREQGKGAAEPRSDRRSKPPRHEEAASVIVVSRALRAGHFRVEMGPVSFEVSHVQAWDLAQSLLVGLQHAHVGQLSKGLEDEDEEEGEGEG